MPEEGENFKAAHFLWISDMWKNIYLGFAYTGRLLSLVIENQHLWEAASVYFVYVFNYRNFQHADNIVSGLLAFISAVQEGPNWSLRNVVKVLIIQFFFNKACFLSFPH